MKKLPFIILLIVLAVTTVYGQANYVIEIGDGTSTTHSMPCDGYWSYAWSTYILTTEQIGTPMLINEIQFDVDNNPSNYTMNNQQLYLKQTTANTVSGAYPEPTNNDFTLVFDGSVTWDGRGWQGVFLDSEFAYDGNSNLQLV